MTNISVCMALYNGRRYLEEQLNSILVQLSKTDEVIISDDGSSDGSVELVQALNDPRIKLIVHDGPSNLILNFENALTRAGGRYIFLSDQDDVWEPDKVKAMLACLKSHDLVVSDCSIIDSNGAFINKSYFTLRNSGKGFIKNLIKNRYVGCCMAFNRVVLEKALPFPNKIPMHDWWIGMIAQIFYNPVFYEKALVKYRRHDNNRSPFINHRKYGFLKQITFRIRLLWALFKICVK